MKKKICAFVFAIILSMTMVSTALASVITYVGSGITSAKWCGNYTKSSSTSTIHLQTTTLEYDNNGTLTYHYVRAYSPDKVDMYSSKKKVYLGPVTYLNFNSDGASATSYKLKVENPYYYDLQTSSYPMRFEGTIN